MIHFKCPTCQQQLKAHDNIAGTKVLCPNPKCGQKLLIPTPRKPASLNKTTLGEPLSPNKTILGEDASYYAGDAPPVRRAASGEATSSNAPAAEESVGEPGPNYGDYPKPGMPAGTKIGIFVVVPAAVLLAIAFLVLLLSSGSNRTEQPHSNNVNATAHSAPTTWRQDDTGDVVILGGFGVLLFFVAFFLIILQLFWILLLVWVARDARRRGIDGAAVWVIVVFFTGFIGLLVYLAARPYGTLVVCQRCHNRKMQMAVQCPHCGQPA